MKSAFYAYDSGISNVRESVREAEVELRARKRLDLQPWENLKKGGIIILDEILAQIDDCNVFCADCTSLNPNVLFELGYAIARQKHILITLDTSLTAQVRRFDDFGLLSPVRYVSSTNDQEIVSVFSDQNSYEEGNVSLYTQLLKPYLQYSLEEHILHLKPKVETNANKRVTRYLNSRQIKLRTDDPTEALQSLPWYAREVFNSVGVVCHFLANNREDSEITNARYGLIAGLAHGLNKPVLMIAEQEYQVPFDYRLLLHKYRDANQAVEIVNKWIEPLEKSYIEIIDKRKESQAIASSTNELKDVYLGQIVAENEIDDLVQNYFVETSTYRDAIEGRTSIFIGRKGVGKSATLYKLQYELSQDPKCFVCLIKPEAYELTGLLRLINERGGIDTASYALQSLWKYLILSELAVQLYREIILRPAYSYSIAEHSLVEWITSNERLLKGDFATRLEDAIGRILDSSKNAGSLLDWREDISRKLHGGPIRDLNEHLRGVLLEKRRVAILIDNLDRAWDTDADIEQLSSFILALLSVSSSFRNLFDKKVTENINCNLSLTLFLRSDIFHRVRKNAREADKINYKKIDWADEELLSRVVEERFVANSSGKLTGADFWARYFKNGIDAKKTILRFIFPRPRDFLFCTRAALEVASNRNQPYVRPEDLVEALASYSRFALDSVVTESKITGFDIESIISEFIGCKPYLTHREVADKLKVAGIESDLMLPVVRELCLVGFLGLAVSERSVRFLDDIDEYDRVRKLANQFAIKGTNRFSGKSDKQLIYGVRTAFWPFLEVEVPGSESITSK